MSIAKLLSRIKKPQLMENGMTLRSSQRIIQPKAPNISSTIQFHMLQLPSFTFFLRKTIGNEKYMKMKRIV